MSRIFFSHTTATEDNNCGCSWLLRNVLDLTTPAYAVVAACCGLSAGFFYYQIWRRLNEPKVNGGL